MRNSSDTTVLLAPARRDDGDPTLAPEVVVDHAVAALPVPNEPAERLRYLSLVEDLGLLDGFSAAALLHLPTDRFGGAYTLLPCYAAVVEACDALVASGYALPGRELLMHRVREQVRDELARLPQGATALWIVPGHRADRTAAHVAALIMALGGQVARPWLWDGIPANGRFLVVGRDATTHPAATHHRCAGAHTFAGIAGRLAQAA